MMTPDHASSLLQPMSEPYDHIKKDCWSIVNVLPSQHWRRILFNANETHSDKHIKATATAWLYEKCLNRYHALLTHIHRNDVKMTYPHDPITAFDFVLPNLTKPTLMIFDMDRTILDQGAGDQQAIEIKNGKEWEELHKRVSTRFNAQDLLFRIQTITHIGRELAYLVVFRPFLMQLIDQYHDSSHFIIYSMAKPSCMIPHLILIEMYYNYCRAAPSAKLFQFDYIIGRLRNEQGSPFKLKSLNKMTKLLGDVSQIQKMIIIDDQGPFVWSNSIPEVVKNNSCGIFAIRSIPFIATINDGNPQDLPFHLSIRIRARDTFLHIMGLLMEQLKTISATSMVFNNTFYWMTYQQIQQVLFEGGVIS